MKNLIARFVREEEGQDIIEYSLLAAFISISGYLVLQSIGSNVNTIYSKVQTATIAASSRGLLGTRPGRARTLRALARRLLVGACEHATDPRCSSSGLRTGGRCASGLHSRG